MAKKRTNRLNIVLSVILGALLLVLCALIITQSLSKDSSAQSVVLPTNSTVYLRNGTECETTFQGTYDSVNNVCTLSSDYNTINAVVIISGAETNGMTLDGNNYTINFPSGSSVARTVTIQNNEDFTLKNLTVNGSNITGNTVIGNYGHGFTLENVNINQTGLYGLYNLANVASTNTTPLTISNTTITSTGTAASEQWGIYLGGYDDTVINGLTVDYSNSIRLVTGIRASSMRDSKNITVSNSTFIGNGLADNTYPSFRAGIFLGGLGNNTITLENNVVADFNRGVLLRSAGTTTPNVSGVLNENVVFNSSQDDLACENTIQCTGADNVFEQQPTGNVSGLGYTIIPDIYSATDFDGDTVLNDADNCKFVANADQADADGDGLGNACDEDSDNDGVLDTVDVCPYVADPDQEVNQYGVGVACDTNEYYTVTGSAYVYQCGNAGCPEVTYDGFQSGDTITYVFAVDTSQPGYYIDAFSGDKVYPTYPVNSFYTDVLEDFSTLASPDPNVADSVEEYHHGYVDYGYTYLDMGPGGAKITVYQSGDLTTTPWQIGDAVYAGQNITVYNTTTGNYENVYIDVSGTITDYVGEPLVDTDGDGIADPFDNCPEVSNPDQIDIDHDGIGDACDPEVVDPRETYTFTGEVTGISTQFYIPGVGWQPCTGSCELDGYIESKGFSVGQQGLAYEAVIDIGGTGWYTLADGTRYELNPATPGYEMYFLVEDVTRKLGVYTPADENLTEYHYGADQTTSSFMMAGSNANRTQIMGPGGIKTTPWEINGTGVTAAEVVMHTNAAGNMEMARMDLAMNLDSISGVSNDNDEDGVLNDADNCPNTPNPDQADLDADGIGDVCDDDVDGDGLLNDVDVFPYSPDGVCEYDPANMTRIANPLTPGQVEINGTSYFTCYDVLNAQAGSIITLNHEAVTDGQRMIGVVAEGSLTLTGGIDGNEVVTCSASKAKSKSTCDITVSNPIEGQATVVQVTTETSTVEDPTAEYQLVCNKSGKNCKNVPVLTASLMAVLPPQGELNTMANVVVEDGGTFEAVTDPTETYANIFTNTSPTEMLTAEYLYSDGVRLGDGTVPAGTEMAMSFPEGGESAIVAYVSGVTEPTLLVEDPLTGEYVAQPLYKNHGQEVKYTKSTNSVVIERLDGNGELDIVVIAQDGTEVATVTTTGGENITVGHEGTDSVDVTNNGDTPVEVVNTATGETTTVDPGETTTETPVYDSDNDGVMDPDDNCMYTYNPDQADQDFDGIGDVCDDDVDGDGVLNDADCDMYNPNLSTEIVGYVDADGDGVAESSTPAYFCALELGTGYISNNPGTAVDNCPAVYNPEQTDSDFDGIGDACDDSDLDGVLDTEDNCPATYNPDQADQDFDGIGDVCDDDIDGDGVLNGADCAPYDSALHTEIVGYVDADGDGVAESSTPAYFCALELGTGYTANNPGTAVDNCPSVYNPDQADEDLDGIGDACDIPDDRDGDGVVNDMDACPDTYGRADYQGCPVADMNIVELHTINIGGGGSTKVPLAGAEVKVFDRTDADFLMVAGSQNPGGEEYGVIFESDAGKIGSCTTDASGECLAGEESVGDMLVIVKYTDVENSLAVYVGRPKDASDFVDTDADGVVDLATKEFQIIKVFKKGAFQGYRGGSKLVIEEPTGSLEVIAPETAIWEGTSSVYPFIFKSDSEWTVNICAEVPEGYAIVGIYDENGNLVTSTECVQTFLAGETKIAAFEVQEVGSPEPDFNVTMNFEDPSGKKHQKSFKVNDVRKNTFKSKVDTAKAKMSKKPKVMLIPLEKMVQYFMNESV